MRRVVELGSRPLGFAMIKAEHLKTETGPCEGGWFIRLTHVPTGIFRFRGPIDPQSARDVTVQFLHEITSELTERGLTQYVTKPEMKTWTAS